MEADWGEMMEARENAENPVIVEPELVCVKVGRVTLTFKSVEIEGTGVKFDRASLANHWAPWDGLEGLLKRIDPPVTQSEIDVLGQVPDGPAGKHGYKEFCSAVKTTHGV